MKCYMCYASYILLTTYTFCRQGGIDEFMIFGKETAHQSMCQELLRYIRSRHFAIQRIFITVSGSTDRSAHQQMITLASYFIWARYLNSFL